MTQFERWYLSINTALVAVLLLGVLLIAQGNSSQGAFGSSLLIVLGAYPFLAVVAFMLMTLFNIQLNTRARYLVPRDRNLITDPPILQLVLTHPQIDLVDLTGYIPNGGIVDRIRLL